MKLTQINQEYPKFQLSETQLVRLINLGTRHQSWDQVLMWMDEYVNGYHTLEQKIRLNRARIQIVVSESPADAEASLAGINPAGLDQAERELFYKIKRRIQTLTNQRALNKPKHKPEALANG